MVNTLLALPHEMPSPGTTFCKCGTLENASKEPSHPIRWDERMQEYYLDLGQQRHMMIHYCPFCGGKTPESRRGSFFAHVTQAEETRILLLFKDIRTVSDMIARFGPPDEEREFGTTVRHPEHKGKPACGEAYRTLVYNNLSPVAHILFAVGTGDCVQGSWMQKYTGEPKI